MRPGICLRDDYDGSLLRRLARWSADANQTRRLLALAAIYDGASRSEAARLGGVTVQIIRDWVLRFNSQGPDALIDRKAPGKPPVLTDKHRAALAAVIEAGPRPYIDGVVRWRLVDLAAWLWDEFQVSVSRQTLGRELRAMGYRKISARPQAYKQDPKAIEAFKKTSPPSWTKSGAQQGAR